MLIKIPFSKYQGAGNDFILIDLRTTSLGSISRNKIKYMCDRRFGIGADGLILLKDSINFDFEMQYFNSDGLEGSMCGNGGRCAVAFARDLGIIERKTVFLAVDGYHQAHIDGNKICLKMIDVERVQRTGEDYVLDTGSPHYIKEVSNVKEIDVFRSGQNIRYSKEYVDRGINVNFVEPISTGYKVRTYERGVEDETLACGTGATAVAIAMAYKNGYEGAIETLIQVEGGELKIKFTAESERFYDVWLEGPANLVFKGEIKLPDR